MAVSDKAPIIGAGTYTRRAMRDAAVGRDRLGAGLLLIAVSTVSYSAMPIFGKLAYASGLRPVSLLAWRFALALVLLEVMALRRTVARQPPRQRTILWGLGGVFVVNSYAYFAALERAPAATVSLIVYTYPVLVTLLSAAIGLDRLTVRGLAAALLAAAGAGLTAGSAPGGFRGAGVWLALASAVGYASYIILGSRFASGVPTKTAARHVAQACTAFYVPLAAMRGEPMLPRSPSGWVAVLGLGLVCTVVAIRAFLAALERLGPARAAVASSLEVPITLLLAMAFLGEAVALQQWGGGALILGAVVLQNWPGRRTKI
jgi:drug/metabolite transporter (DMT)-like permease